MNKQDTTELNGLIPCIPLKWFIEITEENKKYLWEYYLTLIDVDPTYTSRNMEHILDLKYGKKFLLSEPREDKTYLDFNSDAVFSKNLGCMEISFQQFKAAFPHIMRIVDAVKDKPLKWMLEPLPIKELTGIELIALERHEQMTKHGKTIEYDVTHNYNDQMQQAIIALLHHKYGDMPDDWNKEIINKMMSKDIIGRLALIGAFAAAEIDRLKASATKVYGKDAYEQLYPYDQTK